MITSRREKRDLKSGDLWARDFFHCFSLFFHNFLWLADKFILDNFPPDKFLAIGNLSFLELVRGEVVFCGTCPPMNLSTWEFVHLGTCLPRNSVYSGTCPGGSYPTLRLKGAQKPSNWPILPKCWQFISNKSIHIKNVHSSTVRPKGAHAQKPSNWHIPQMLVVYIQHK